MEESSWGPWLEPFNGVWHDLCTLAPRLTAAFIVLVLGLLLAWLAQTAIEKIFESKKLDPKLGGLWIQRFFTRGMATPPGKAAGNFFFYSILAAGLLLALRLLGLGLSQTVIGSLIDLLPRVLTFMLVLFLGALLANFLSVFAQMALTGVGAQHPHLVGKLVAWGTLGVAILMSVEQLGLAGQFLTQLVLIASAAAGLALAIAFGLGCKDLAREFLMELIKEDDHENATHEP